MMSTKYEDLPPHVKAACDRDRARHRAHFERTGRWQQVISLEDLSEEEAADLVTILDHTLQELREQDWDPEDSSDD